MIAVKFYMYVTKQIVKDWIESYMLWSRIRKKIYTQCSPKVYWIPNSGVWSLFETMNVEEIIALSKQCSFSKEELDKLLFFSGHQTDRKKNKNTVNDRYGG